MTGASATTSEVEPTSNPAVVERSVSSHDISEAESTPTAAAVSDDVRIIPSKRSSAVLNNVNPELLKCLNGIFAGPGSGGGVMRPLPNTRSRQTTASGAHRGPRTTAAASQDAGHGGTSNGTDKQPMVPHPIKRTKSRLLRVSDNQKMACLKFMAITSVFMQRMLEVHSPPRNTVFALPSAGGMSFLDQIKAKKNSAVAGGMSFLDQIKAKSATVSQPAPTANLSFLEQIRANKQRED